MNGKLTIAPEVARDKANQFKRVANELESLLNDISIKMQQVNDEQGGMYVGNKRPAQLRSELDQCRNTFHKIYDQVNKFSDDIILISNTMERE